ncbi:MAG: DUF72 domain-containing protein [Deferribacteraceae bacterium]|jgi:uncharacterized protein YecE (DUF72 family)|nr:DUF72 domain-containing protein [Deferribacteraceae bacterium]
MLLNDTPVYIGTSGYNYEDWKGRFAPKGITNYDMLSYYAEQGLNFLELAFTFYRFPERDKIEHILHRTNGKVRFSVRIPKVIMHHPSDKKVINEFLKGLSPMIDAGLLESFFADFLPAFVSSKANYQHILALRNAFKGNSLFIELQSRTWYKEKTFDFFRENNIGLTTIDMPDIKGTAPYYPTAVNYYQYYKLYGRSPKWIAGADKFLDYSYSDRELAKILRDALSGSVTAKAIIIIFANVAEGYAPQNALKLKGMIEGRHNGSGRPSE